MALKNSQKQTKPARYKRIVISIAIALLFYIQNSKDHLLSCMIAVIYKGDIYQVYT